MSSPPFRRRSRDMALCGLMAALSAVLLLLYGLVPLATFACPMLAMVCLIPVLRECGSRPALAVYAAVSLLALLFVPDKELALFYVFLGYYPVLRPTLDRVRGRILSAAAKCGVFSAAMAVLYLLILFLFRLEAVAEEFASYTPPLIAGLLLLGNVTFLLFDRALAQLSLLYEAKFRRRFFR